MENYLKYEDYLKPAWAPPSWLFGPVWSILYTIIFSTFGFVFYQALNKKIPAIVVFPFILNLIFNFAFTYFQFGIRNFSLAAIDILLILITIIWMFIAIWPYYRAVVYLNIPYLLWVSFATLLQLTITYINK
jgi:tryptophan-rich sensory protein